MSLLRRGKAPRHADRRRRLGTWALLPLALGFLFIPTVRTATLPPPMAVQVAGSVRLVPPETTLEQVRREFRLRPRRGHLLDVKGVVLERGRFAGFLTVNGERAHLGAILRHDDVVEVVDGEDRTEATVRHVVEVPPGTVANPQAHLGSTPGEQIIVTGRLSGKVVSSVFRPTGPTMQPRAVALTFDDGPHPKHTLRILRALRRHEAPATFYVVGSMAARHPEIVVRLRDAGMEVASHSMNHPYRSPFGRLPHQEVMREIRETGEVLGEMGIRPATFRPPGGSWSPRSVRIAERLGQRTVLWSVDSRDWTGAGAKAIARGVLRSVRPGSIVLLHDGGGDRSATIRALPRIIRGIRKRNLELVAVR